MAKKISSELNCDLERVYPWFNYTGLLILISFLKISIPVNISNNLIKEYEEIIIIGPVWGGLIICPLRTLIKKCDQLSKPIHFAVTCEASEEDKDNEYGKLVNKNNILNTGIINFCGVLTVLCSEIRHCAKRQNVGGNFKQTDNAKI